MNYADSVFAIEGSLVEVPYVALILGSPNEVQDSKVSLHMDL